MHPIDHQSNFQPDFFSSLPVELLTKIFTDVLAQEDINYKYPVSKKLAEAGSFKNLFKAVARFHAKPGNENYPLLVQVIHALFNQQVIVSKKIDSSDLNLLEKVLQKDPLRFLKEAIISRDDQALRFILQTPQLDLTVINSDNRLVGDEALLLACELGNAEAVKLLLNFGKQNSLMEDESTDLLNRGILDPSRDGNMALRIATKVEQDQTKVQQKSSRNFVAIVKLLLQDDRVRQNVQVAENEPFTNACAKGSIKILEMLKPLVNLNDQQKAISLYQAVEHKHLEVTKYLIQTIEIDPSLEGSLALRMACYHNSYDIVDYLLKEGRSDPTDANSQQADGRNAFALAIEKNSIEVLHRLLEEESIEHLLDKDGFHSYFEKVCEKKMTSLVELDKLQIERERLCEIPFSEAGLAKVNVKIAKWEKENLGNSQTLKIFLEHPFFNPQKALMVFCEYELDEHLSILLQDPRIKDHEIVEAFFQACQMGKAFSVKILLDQPFLTVAHLNQALDLIIKSEDSFAKDAILSLFLEHPLLDLQYALKAFSEYQLHKELEILLECPRIENKDIIDTFFQACKNGKHYSVGIFLHNPAVTSTHRDQALRQILGMKILPKGVENVIVNLLNDRQFAVGFEPGPLLNWAIIQGFDHLVKYLLEKKSMDPNALNHHALKIAIEKDNTCFQLLFEHPKTLLTIKELHPLIELAKQHNSFNALNLLENQVLTEKFYQACRQGAPLELIQAFLDEPGIGAKEVNLALAWMLNSKGKIDFRHDLIAQELIQTHKVDLNRHGNQLLAWAILHNFDELARVLLTKDAIDPNASNHLPMLTAIQNNNLAIINFLLEHPKLIFTEESLATFKSCAIECKNAELVEYFDSLLNYEDDKMDTEP